MNIVRLMLLSRQMKNRRHEKDNMVTGIPPLTFIANKTGTLKNYRIYGNTVSSESVGDKTSNLFDEATAQNVTEGISVNKWVHIQVGEGTFTLSTNMPNITTSGFAANIFFLAGNVSTGANSATNGVTDNTPITVSSSDGYVTVGLRNANSYNPKDYNIMLNTGSTVLPYEPYGYKIPLTLTADSAETTDIYLDAPLAKSGNNADYIDYATQKRHNSDGTESSVTLPEIAVTAGTNTLTVGTEIQPSRVELTGRIKEGES